MNMNSIVPLISSGVAGPLGVLHLPRLWLKLSLEARGKLAPGYPGAGKGFDQMVIDGLGLNREAVDLVRQTNPLPAICGRVCVRKCEVNCMRNNVDEPVGINFVKRFLQHHLV